MKLYLFRTTNPAVLNKANRIGTHSDGPLFGALYGTVLPGVVIVLVAATCGCAIETLSSLLNLIFITELVLPAGNGFTFTVNFLLIEPRAGMSSGVQTKELVPAL